MRLRFVVPALLLAAGSAAHAQQRPHNVILFVADGMRPGMATAATTPTMLRVMTSGVSFPNAHSIFPTFTTANAAGLATGHMPGDSGDFSNTIYAGFPVQSANGAVTPFLENDRVLTEMDAHYAGDYLNAETILKAARAKNFATASIGKVGPARIMDHADPAGGSIIVDDSTGRPEGVALSDDLRRKLAEVGLPAQAPTRGGNGKAGGATEPGATVANVEQQAYFADVTTKAVLPILRARNQPFVLVYWSRDPDGSQHNQGDSLGKLLPGINGPTSLAAIRNADDNLAQLLAALAAEGLDKTTDMILTSDHGFSTISKESATSWAASQNYAGVVPGQLPPGFLALDLAHALGKQLFDPDSKNAPLAPGVTPARANGLIGETPERPDIVVAANGGSDLIYLPGGDRQLAQKIVTFLSTQDYVSGLFVDDAFGDMAGALPLSAISLYGTAATPRPALVVNFRSFSTGCADATTCGVEIADTGLQQGQGMHGSFSRADTLNIMAATGPSFRSAFVDPLPASNADIGMTIAHLLGLDIQHRGKLTGRVLTEAMPNGATPIATSETRRSAPDANGLVTSLNLQRIGETLYFDAAGYPGRTLGLQP